MSASCPDRKTLLAFSLGELPEPELVRLGMHLEACPICTDALAGISVADSLVTGLRRGGNEHTPSLALLDRIFARITDSTSSTSRTPPRLALEKTVTDSRNFGDYDILELIAHGGMGTVYKARQRKLNRLVALKVIQAGRLATPADVVRFRTEAAAAAFLDHPGIVPVFDFGESEGQYYYSMAFVDGCSLADKLAAGRTLPPRAAAELIKTVAESVAFAHQRGIVHRDLKPGNILLDGQGKPRVTDFGLAKFVQGKAVEDTAATRTAHDLTQTGQILGTPAFMSPEQATGGGSAEVGVATDVYSLGAVLYATLTGKTPFSAGSVIELLRAVQAEEPASPRHWDASIPKDLETICLKCLEKLPQRRLVSARELADELERFLSGRAIHSRPVSRLERAARWVSRNPAFATANTLAVLAVFLLALVGVIGRLWMTASHDRAEARRSRDELAIANEQLDLSAYAHQVQLAQARLQSGDAVNSHALLHNCQPARRGWEWQHLRLAVDSQLGTKLDTGANLNDFAIGRDGTLATLSDQSIGVWDIDKRRRIANLTQAANAMCLSPNGRAIALGNHSVWIWPWQSQSMARELLRDQERPQNQIPFQQVVFSPRGTRLAAQTLLEELFVWDVPNEKLITRISKAEGKYYGQGFAFSPDDALLATAGKEDRIELWDTHSGKLRATLGEVGQAFRQPLFCSHGKQLAAIEIEKGAVWLFSVDSDALGRRLFGTERTSGIISRRDDKYLACLGNDIIHTWDFSEQKLSSHRAVNTAPFTNTAFSPDETQLAHITASDGRVCVYDAYNFDSLLSFDCASSNKVEFSLDGKTIFSKTERQSIRILDVSPDAAESVRRIAGTCNDASFSANGSLCVTLEETSQGQFAYLRDFEQHRVVSQVNLGQAVFSKIYLCPDRSAWLFGGASLPMRWHPETATELGGSERHHSPIEFNRNGELMASIGADGSANLWSTSDQRICRLRPPGVPPLKFHFSEDGGRLAAVFTRRIEVFDTREGRRTVDLKPGPDYVEGQDYLAETQLSFNKSGRWLCATTWGKSTLWDTLDSQRAWSIPTESHASLAQISPNGEIVVIAEGEEMSVWSVASKKRLLTLKGHRAPIQHAIFSADGTRLVSCDNNTVCLWDPRIANSLTSSRMPSATVGKICFSPDESCLAAFGSGEIRCWFREDTPTRRVARERRWETRLQRLRRLPTSNHVLGFLSTEGSDVPEWKAVHGFSVVGSPALSADGGRVAFDGFLETDSLKAQCVIGDRIKGDWRVICTGATPRWSPDGLSIVLMREGSMYDSEKRGVFIFPLNGDKERRVTDDGRWPEWSPDGTRIAFSRGGAGGGAQSESKIFTCRLDGTDEMFVCDGDCPTWSPDGRRIACCRVAADRGAESVIHNLQTGESKVIGTGWYRSEWSADGKWIYTTGYTSAGGTSQPIRISTSGDQPSEVLSPEISSATAPSLSRDGRYLVIASQTAELRKHYDADR